MLMDGCYEVEPTENISSKNECQLCMLILFKRSVGTVFVTVIWMICFVSKFEYLKTNFESNIS